MATTFVEYTGDGQASKQFTFPSYQESDVKVRVDGVLKTTSTHYNITNYTTTGGGNVVFTSGNIPSSPANIRIYRDTNVDTAKATFTAGSSVKAADLNNNTTQLLYRAQEEQIPNLIHSWDIDDGAIETSKIKADAITSAKIADDQINSEHYVDGSIDTAHIADAQITTAKLAADAVTSAKIADDAIDSEHIGNGAINSSDMLADNVVTTAKIAANSVTNSEIATATILTGNIANGNINTAKIQDDAVTNAKIANNAVDADQIAASAVTTAKINNDAVTNAKLADNSVDVPQLVSSSVTTVKINDNAVVTGKLANSAVTEAKIADNAVSTAKIEDSELKTLAGMQSGTASRLADSTPLTATTAELNQLDGITLETSVTTNSDTRIPTSKAVNDLVLSVTNALGGFVAIANETSFPTANPDPSNNAGTVVSISQLSTGLAVNSSGVATISNGAGTGNTVTITGFPTNLQSQTLPVNSGLQVQTTSTSGDGSANPPRAYTFHKQLASAADIQAISATVNSFSNRYRVSASAPTSSLDGGDLWYDTTNSKLMVYSSQNSAWEESSAIGNFFISTISSSSNTGGGSATPNGTAYRFTISDAPTTAAACIVSVDGVIQKPNSGSSQPSEGFVLVGNDIILGAAPANGASLFVTVIGSTVGIGTPSDNTVTSAILQNGSVTTAKIVDANVTTAKIAKPLDFADNEKARFGTGNDLQILHDGSNSRIKDTGTGSLKVSGSLVDIENSDTTKTMARFVGGGAAELYHNNVKKVETVTGGANVTGALGVNTTSPASTIDARAASNASITARNTGTAASITIAVGSSTNQLVSRGVNVATARDLIFMVGSTTATRLDSNGHLRPETDSTFDLGSNAIRWRNFYADTLYGDGSNLTGINTDLVSDTSPQLGGNLSTNGNNITSADSTGGGNNRIVLGSGGDLNLYSDGTNVRYEGNNLHFKNANGDEFLAKMTNGGAVELYHNNLKKFETTSTGISVSNSSDNSTACLVNTTGTTAAHGIKISSGGTGAGTNLLEVESHNQATSKTRFKVTADGHVTIPTDSTGSNEGRLQIGASQDLEIYHGGTHTRIDNNTGALYIRNNTGTYNGNPIQIQALATEDSIKCNPNGAVELYYDNDKSIETSNQGAKVFGTSTYTTLYMYNDGGYLSGRVQGWRNGSGDDCEVGFAHHDSANWFVRFDRNNSSGQVSEYHWQTVQPASNNAYDLGSTVRRWRNIYTNDLNLSNEGSSNDVDGSWGDWTIQEGESDLFLKNNRSGKKYKFNLTEVS